MKYSIIILVKYDIKNLNSIVPVTCPGGKTYEILIGGKNKDYATKDFAYRVSYATIDLEESVFSDLPMVNRYIATINSSLKLEHCSPMTDKKMAEISLEPFDMHCFDGGMKTISHGKAATFNLMIDKFTAGGDMKLYKYYDGEITVKDNEHKNYGCEVKYIVFCVSGQVEIKNANQVLNVNDYIIEENGDELLLNPLTEDTKYIVCIVIYKE